jgi:hypothetical protein
MSEVEQKEMRAQYISVGEEDEAQTFKRAEACHARTQYVGLILDRKADLMLQRLHRLPEYIVSSNRHLFEPKLNEEGILWDDVVESLFKCAKKTDVLTRLACSPEDVLKEYINAARNGLHLSSNEDAAQEMIRKNKDQWNIATARHRFEPCLQRLGFRWDKAFKGNAPVLRATDLEDVNLKDQAD